MSEVVVRSEKFLEISSEEQFDSFFETVFDEMKKAVRIVYFTDCTDPRKPINIHELTQGEDFVKFDIYQQWIGMTDRPIEDYVEYLIMIEDKDGNAYFSQFNLSSKKIKIFWRHQQYIESKQEYQQGSELYEV